MATNRAFGSTMRMSAAAAGRMAGMEAASLTLQESARMLREHGEEHRWRQGIVYFVRSGDPDGHVKIGWTRGDPRTRMSALKTANPYPLEFVGFLPGSQELERHLHAAFAGDRVGGEWFLPSFELLDELEWAYPEPRLYAPGDDPEWAVPPAECAACAVFA